MAIVRVSRRSHYTAIPNVVLESHELSFKARGLLCYLLSKPDHWETSTQAMAREAKKDGRDSIRAAMQELREAGFAQIVRHRGERGHITTRWILYDQPISEQPAPDNPAPENPPGPDYPAPVEPSSGKPVPLVFTDQQIPNKKNPPLYSPHRYSATFDQFWTLYPRKTAKPKAYDIWRRKGLHAIADQIIASVQAHIETDPQWLDPQFIPHPTTYLNQGRWEDEINSQPSPPRRQTCQHEAWEIDNARVVRCKACGIKHGA